MTNLKNLFSLHPAAVCETGEDPTEITSHLNKHCLLLIRLAYNESSVKPKGLICFQLAREMNKEVRSLERGGLTSIINQPKHLTIVQEAV